jgi:hypothetical protein
MSHTHSFELAPPPARLTLPASVRALAAVAVFAGAAALTWTVSTGDTTRAWSAYLIGVFLTLGLGVFGVAWLAILNLSGATWSVTMRRIPEAMTAWLIPGGVLALALGLGAHELYEWSHTDAVAADALLTHKAQFLNMGMFWALVGASLLLWIVFGRLITQTSYRQDREGGVALTGRRRVLSAIFIVIFAISLSVVSFYFLMSLEPHWFSTMMAVLVFTDVMQAGTAFVAVVAGLLIASGTLRGFLNEHHLHSLGKMMFAWTGFWAYIYFCQFMLIWYANLPEETVYFLRRSANGWLTYMLVLPVLKFAVPFLVLLPREAKRTPGRLVPMAMLILFAQFWELYLMVAPALGHGGEPAHARLPVIEFVVALGFLGLFTLVFGWALARHDAVPLKDPSLAECLAYQS